MKALDMPWKKLAIDIKDKVSHDNLFQGAAGLAFYAMLSLFPALIFLISAIGYLPLEGMRPAIMDFLHEAMPAEGASFLQGTVQRILGKGQADLVSFGILGAVSAASSGMYATMLQLNRTYGVGEKRPFLKARSTALLLTLCFGLLLVVAFLLIVLGGIAQGWLLKEFGFGDAIRVTFSIVRWMIIFASLLFGFALVYYLGPNVKQKFKWFSPGSVSGVVLLVGASIGFRIYVMNFGNYDAMYGVLGTFIVLMLWLYICSVVLLLGSEINVVVEKHAPVIL